MQAQQVPQSVEESCARSSMERSSGAASSPEVDASAKNRLPDVRLLAECLRFADDDCPAVIDTLQAIATLCSTSVDACEEFVRNGVMEKIMALAFETRHTPSSASGDGRKTDPEDMVACQLAALRTLACAASISDLSCTLLARESTVRHISRLLPRGATDRKLSTMVCLLLASLLGSSGNVLEMCWREGILQHLCDLFTFGVMEFLDKLSSESHHDSSADEKLSSSVVSTLCLAMSSSNSGLVDSVQSVVSQLFPVCKVALEKLAPHSEQQESLLSRVCALLSSAINNNCANQDRSRISGVLRASVGCLRRAVEQGTVPGAMSAELLGQVLETVTVACTNNDVNKATVCNMGIMPLYCSLLSHHESIAGGTLATRLLLAILCILDYGDNSTRSFVESGAVPLLIRTVVNCKDSDVHKAAILVLDTVNKYEGSNPQLVTGSAASGSSSAHTGSVRYTSPQRTAGQTLSHSTSASETVGGAGTLDTRSALQAAVTTSPHRTPIRHHTLGEITQYHSVAACSTGRAAPKCQVSAAGTPRPNTDRRQTTPAVSPSLYRTAAPGFPSTASFSRSPAAALHSSDKTARLTPVAIPDPVDQMSTGSRQSLSRGIQVRSKNSVDTEIEPTNARCAPVSSSNTRSHKAFASDASSIVRDTSGPGSRDLRISSIRQDEVSSPASEAPVCMVCKMSALGRVTSRSFSRASLGRAKASLCAEHRSSRWNMDEFAAASSCVESDASFVSSNCHSMAKPHIDTYAYCSDSSVVFETTAAPRKKKRKLLSARNMTACITPLRHTATSQPSVQPPLSRLSECERQQERERCGRVEPDLNPPSTVHRELLQPSCPSSVVGLGCEPRAESHHSVVSQHNSPIRDPPLHKPASHTVGSSHTNNAAAHLAKSKASTDMYVSFTDTELTAKATAVQADRRTDINSTGQHRSRDDGCTSKLSAFTSQGLDLSACNLDTVTKNLFPVDLLDMSMEWKLGDGSEPEIYNCEQDAITQQYTERRASDNAEECRNHPCRIQSHVSDDKPGVCSSEWKSSAPELHDQPVSAACGPSTAR
eukprot:scpid29780/ scgid30709/ 